MKIGIVTSFPSNQKESINDYAFHLLKNFVLKEEINEVILFCNKTNQSKQLNFELCEKITVVDSWELNKYSSILKLYKSIQEYNPDYLLYNLKLNTFGHYKLMNFLGLLMPVLSKILRIKSFVLFHDFSKLIDMPTNTTKVNVNQVFKKIWNASLIKLILGANYVIINSSNLKKTLEYRYKAKHLLHIPYGIHEAIPMPKFSCARNTNTVLTFGNLESFDKLEVLIEAVSRLRHRIKENINLYILVSKRSDIKCFTENIHNKYLSKNFIHFIQETNKNEFTNVLVKSTVLVYTQTSIKTIHKELEQIARYGKAALLPNEKNITETLPKEGYSCEFFNPHDIESLVMAIQSLVLNDVKRIQLGKINYNTLSAYPMSRICNIYLDIFKSFHDTNNQSPNSIAS